MSKLATSYYQSQKLDPAKHLVVQTSIGSPRWGKQPEWEAELVTPAPEVLALAEQGEMIYTRAYVAQLEKTGVDAIRAELNELSAAAEAENKIAVLCCFEALKKPGQFCHRRIFSWWWATKTGENIAEL